jgi:hypothetical protein
VKVTVAKRAKGEMAMKNHRESDTTTASFDLTTAIPRSQPFARLRIFSNSIYLLNCRVTKYAVPRSWGSWGYR